MHTKVHTMCIPACTKSLVCLILSRGKHYIWINTEGPRSSFSCAHSLPQAPVWRDPEAALGKLVLWRTPHPTILAMSLLVPWTNNYSHTLPFSISTLPLCFTPLKICPLCSFPPDRYPDEGKALPCFAVTGWCWLWALWFCLLACRRPILSSF